MTSSLSFRHLLGWFACARLSDPQLIPSGRTFSSTLTTKAFGHSSLRCFEACSCKPTPRDLPSSPVQPRGTLSPTYHQKVTRLNSGDYSSQIPNAPLEIRSETSFFSFNAKNFSSPNLRSKFQIQNRYSVENGSAVPARPYSRPKNQSSSHHLIASEMKYK